MTNQLTVLSPVIASLTGLSHFRLRVPKCKFFSGVSFGLDGVEISLLDCESGEYVPTLSSDEPVK